MQGVMLAEREKAITAREKEVDKDRQYLDNAAVLHVKQVQDNKLEFERKMEDLNKQLAEVRKQKEEHDKN